MAHRRGGRHAELRVDAAHRLFVTDRSSYGSALNGAPLTRGVEVPLADRDRLELGVNGCACVLERVPLRVGTSGVVPGASSGVRLRTCAVWLTVCLPVRNGRERRCDACGARAGAARRRAERDNV